MAMRSPAGFISAFFDPLKNPNAPTSPSATGGNASASVTFTAPANVGGSAITAYYAVSNPSQFTGTAASSPVSVTGLTNGTAYTFNVWALNSYGPGVWSAATGSVTPAVPAYALVAGGYNTGGTAIATTNYFLISTTGNPTSFGNLATGRGQAFNASSTTRAVFGGGRGPSSSTGNTLVDSEYTTFASTGTYANFGEMSSNRSNGASFSNATYGIYVCGDTSGGSVVDTVSRVTIATTGNAASFGTFTDARDSFFQGCSSSTRGVAGGGINDSGTNQSSMSYTTISTTGSFTSFGNLTAVMPYVSAASNATRGLFAGSSSPDTNTISYITIATTGNATSFGQLTGAVGNRAGVASTTRAVWSGGGNGQNVMNYVEISTTGNATSFGQLITAVRNATSASSIHGGVQ